MKALTPRSTLLELWEAMRQCRPEWSAGYRSQIRAAITTLATSEGHMPTLGELDTDGVGLMLRMMEHMRKSERQPITMNRYRSAILVIWGEAHRGKWIKTPRPLPIQVPTVKVPHKQQQEWSFDEIDRLIRACHFVPTKRGWGPPHWQTLLHVALETSVSFGELLRVRLQKFDTQNGLLTTPNGTIYRLYSETAAMVAVMPRLGDASRLFPWPFNERVLYRDFRVHMLGRAGLRTAQVDWFRKLRHATLASHEYLDAVAMSRIETISVSRR